MGLLDWLGYKQKEDRSVVNYSLGSNGGTIYSTFTTTAPINEERAMNIPAVVACVELITGSIGQLPIYLYKQNDKGEVVKVQGDRREFLLNNEPNPTLNGYNFKKHLAKDFLFYGVSYTKMEQVRNQVLELYPFDMRYIQATRYLIDGYKYDADIRLITYGLDGRSFDKIFKPYELIMIAKDSRDGITSRGVLEDGADVLQLALNEQEYTSNILVNGALPIGVLKAANRLSKDAVTRLREGWSSLYSGAKNSGKTVILEEGLEYDPISLKPNDLQLVDGKKITTSEIARLFNVPESMISADANKYASNEQNNLYFLQYTLSPILFAIESALDKALLLEDEKQEGYYFRFDTSEILRTTEKERVESAIELLKGGAFSVNETRAKFDMPKLDDDYFMWSLGNVLFNPQTHDMFVPNMQGSSDLDKGPVPGNGNLQGANPKPLPAKQKPNPKGKSQ